MTTRQFLLGIMALLLAGPCSVQAEFRAGAAKVDITPPTSQWLMGYGARQSTAVHDRIYHRIAVMHDGATEVVIVASDICVFSPSVYDDTAAMVKRELGIEPRQLWWTVTHTHSAPEVGPPGIYDVLLKGRSDHEWSREYLALVQSALLQGIRDARARLAPARVTTGTGHANANINRRARDLDGTITLGLNPDGPVDRQIGLVRLEKPDGGLIALIANYSMHGTALGGQWLEISGDAPGIAAAYVEEKLGGSAPVLYVNGAAGNIAPIYTTQANARAAHLGEFRVLLGNKILAANAALAAAGEARLKLIERIIDTPRRAGLGWPAELGGYAAKSAGGADLIRIPVRALAIGSHAVLWGAPVELFCEISFRVRNESAFAHTFYFGYTNGWLGYLPTAAAFNEGGYEPRTSPFTPQVEKDFGDGVVSAIAALR